MEERKKDNELKSLISETIGEIEELMRSMVSDEVLEQSNGPNYSWLSSRKRRNLHEKMISKQDAADLESLLAKLEPAEWRTAFNRLNTSLTESRNPPIIARDVPKVFQRILKEIIDDRGIINAIREATQTRRQNGSNRVSNGYFTEVLKHEDICSSIHITTL